MLIQLYAQTDTIVADSARTDIAKLNEWFATKDYDTGMFYFKNKAWDSAILYFKNVVQKWPETEHAHAGDAAARRKPTGRSITPRTSPTSASRCDRCIPAIPESAPTAAA